MPLVSCQIVAAVFTAVCGVLLHYVYGWSDRCPYMAYFCPVNESVWEHLKLLAMPMLLFAAAEYFLYGKGMENFVLIRLLSVFHGMGLIVLLHYLYSGILGRRVGLVDILIYFLSVMDAYLLGTLLMLRGPLWERELFPLSAALVLLLLFLFFRFTVCPPKIALFVDPVTGKYGMDA